MTTGPTITIAIRSAWRFYRDALGAWLARQDHFRLAGTVANDPDLLDLCRLRPPDVVLFDADGTTADALDELRARFPAVGVVVLGERPADLGLAGVACVPYSDGLHALVDALRQEADERRTAGARPAPGLSVDECRIISLIAAGYTVSDIAGRLDLTPGAVESGKRRIFHQLGVAGQNQAVARAAALGLVETAEQTGCPPVPTERRCPELTPRETDILRSIASGHTVRQTARLLDIAEKTVENTQARLFLKLGARNRAGSIAAAHVLGLLDADTPGGKTSTLIY